MSGFVIDEDDYLQHYGIQRRSGRYPWGSGGDAETRSRDFLGMVDDLRKQGLSDTDIARAFSTPENPFNTTMLRATTSIARNKKREADILMAQRLKDKGYSNSAIAERMGIAGESSVRALLAPGAKIKTDQLQNLSSFLKDQVKDKGYIDVGIGVEHQLGHTRTQLDTALSLLKSEGYSVVNVQVDQLGTGNKTKMRVLSPPGMTEKEHYKHLVTHLDDIHPVAFNRTDTPEEYASIKTPLSLDLKRVGINYAEHGGANADGVMYVRPGVDSVSLGGSHYAQVRAVVNGTHYLKGMAIYKDDLPDGVDIVFNTNKSDTGNKLDAMKPLKDDPKDPFGAQIKRQILDHTGKKPTSAMNIVNDEGDWESWTKSLASQMLSKQQPSLAKEQLARTYDSKKKELDEILSLTNPAVRRTLLNAYSGDVDSSAVHLKAAALPRQATKVILPVSKMKETEVYAPSFRDGERVALVRFPHGGTFEIPELTVNNKNPDAVKLLGTQARDAIGIHPNVAKRLSGADFDGDTVLVIPNNAGKVKTSPPLDGLKNFDPMMYKLPADSPIKRMSPKQKQTEMGKVSNLITDMTIKGANTTEIARAVRHSMVVIDAEKHGLNYQQSFIDNNIAQLKTKYQGGPNKGSSTLISRTTGEVRVPKRKQSFKIDPQTGEKIYNYTGETYTSRKVLKNGNIKERVIPKTTLSSRGAETKNAHDLSSGTPIEKIYADHANRLKELANQARKAEVSTRNIPYSPSANKIYAPEVSKLESALRIALRNAPLERQAQVIANAIVKQKRDANPDMDREELKKLSSKALIEARARVGAGKTLIEIDDRQWEAIQAGAISNHKLTQILSNSDLDRVKELATPRKPTVMTDVKQAKARQLLAAGRTPSEVADILGVPVSTLTSSIMRKEGHG